MSERKPYPSDLSDEQWKLTAPVLAAWKSEHRSVSGHQGQYEYREIVNAIFYQNRTGCQWRYLPHDLPPHTAVYYYFALWRDDGTAKTIHDLLRWEVREDAGRNADPSAVSMDTATVRCSTDVPKATSGLDAGKRSPGRKRGIANDVLGLIVAVVIAAANVTDNAIGTDLLDKVHTEAPTVTKAWVDAGFKDEVAIHGALLGIDVEVVPHDPDTRGFVPEPKRWVSEQVLGTLNQHRRLVRDYEKLPASAETQIYWAMTDNMSKRLTGRSTPSWRGPPQLE